MHSRVHCDIDNLMLYKSVVFCIVYENNIFSLSLYCSDFRYESNGIFVLVVGFFFIRQISTF